MAQVGLALALMAILVTTSSSSSRSEPAPQVRHEVPGAPSAQSEKTAAARRVAALFGGIPQSGAALGNPDAPATMHFFADLECLEARQFVLGALPFVVRRWVRGGELRIVYHGFAAETVWPEIFKDQQTAALAAGRQGKLWQYMDFFYHRQGPEFTRYAIAHFLVAMAEDVQGLDLDRWHAAWRDQGLALKVKADVRLGRRYGLRPLRPYTPAFFVGPTGGPARPLLHFSLTESAAFDEAIEGVLRGRA
jgi:protein-disulfide isomerase